MNKNRFFLALSLLIILSFVVSCAPEVVEAPAVVEPAEEEVEEEVTETEVIEEVITVAVVAGGEIGDLGFIDSANEGLMKMESELGLNTEILQTRNDATRFLDDLISAAEMADLIFVVPGYFFDEQLKQVVPQFPDKTFVYVDGETAIEGMTSLRFLENEGAFLAGAKPF